jgi:hypothetical protein
MVCAAEKRLALGRWLVGMVVVILALASGSAAHADVTPCNGIDLPAQGIRSGGPGGTPSQPDLLVTGTCTVRPGQAYYYNNVNIIATYDSTGKVVSSGTLVFTETASNGTTPGGAQTDFWAASILVENNGSMIAGSSTTPYGAAGNKAGTLTIHLYGAPQSGDGTTPPTAQGTGVPCATTQNALTNIGPCGIPLTNWTSNGTALAGGPDPIYPPLPGGVPPDYFYQYGPMFGDAAASDRYFGYKVLGVSYGGTLQLFGYKGTPNGTPTGNTDAGTSWIRLQDTKDLNATGTSLSLDTAPGNKWQLKDEIVVTTTDYLPGHSEELTVDSISGNTVGFHLSGSAPGTGVTWTHNGTRYKLKLGNQAGRLNLDADLVNNGAETRAAVALLTRSIKIVSGGNNAGDPFPAQPTTFGTPGYFFGGHTVFRQGIKSVQIQGVEFYQLGQGGRLGRYPVHFHMVRQVPAGTFIEDSSVHDSMTRWYVIHSTQGVTLARNVGYLSIGHGYYLEDGTEANNQLYSNIGIFARAAVANVQNPRLVPGILAFTGAGASLAYNSDVVHPTAFWITNGWNDFVGNMASGAGTCGACFWLLPAFNTDMPDIPAPMKGMPTMHMKWSGYAGLQTQIGIPGATPLRSFYKNYCSSAMNSFETVGAVDGCLGITGPGPNTDQQIHAVASIAPTLDTPGYYPNLAGNRNPVVCKSDTDCTEATPCNNQDPQNCAVTVLDHYTSSFSWAEQNFSAVWLRTNWYLLTDSVISDVQTAGLTFVGGGDYTRSSAPLGYWALAGHSVFIGQTTPANPLTLDYGPFNTQSNNKLTCNNLTNFCVNRNEGISLPLSSFGVNQRMFNIYDGPTLEDSNAFLDITERGCNSLSDCIYFNTVGLRNDPGKAAGSNGYMPNAAIGWKQPNGFFYPPAFHSTNLFFNNVDIRHYVIAPLFQPGTYLTYAPATQHDYLKPVSTMFGNYTDIDRQTELNDNDGTLTGLIGPVAKTGLVGSISVNEDPFFNAPVATPECLSNLNVTPSVACSPPSTTSPTPSARTSPYDYFTTVVFPGCATQDVGGKDTDCGSTGTPPAQPPPLPPEWVPQRVVGPPGNTTYVQTQLIYGTAGTWSRDCGGPFCFGVKIYRQDLTGTDNGQQTGSTREWNSWYSSKCNDKPRPAGCDWPYDRMAGGGFWQRSVLTANRGTYYIDTTPSQKTQITSGFAGLTSDPNAQYVDCSQRLPANPTGVVGNCQPRSVNVFQAGQTYYVMMLYAKSTTKVTYQIYVGNGFDLGSVKAVAVGANITHLNPSTTLPPNWPAQSQWLTAKMMPGHADILQVSVDLTSFGSILDPKNKATGLCQPKTFCDWGANGASGCGCVLQPPPKTGVSTDPRVAADPALYNRCVSACGTWAVEDLDYTTSGMVGFAITLPTGAGFVANDQDKRPTPNSFPPAVTAIQFVNSSVPPDNPGGGGTCSYPKPLPGSSTSCPVTDSPNVPQ